MVFSFSKQEKERFSIILDHADKHGHSQLITYYAKLSFLDIVKWLKEIDCPWSEWTITYAAERGHLEVVKWLRENGCPWNRWAITNSVWNCHLEVVKWLKENGCPE